MADMAAGINLDFYSFSQGCVYHFARDKGDKGLHHALQYATLDEIFSSVD